MKLLICTLILFLNMNFAENINLDKLKWNNRLLIINGNKDVFNPLLKINKVELFNRDFIVFIISNDEVYHKNRKMPQSFLKSLIGKYGTIKDEMITLVGKDGEVKNKYHLDVDMIKIFNDVDKMPMRKYEIKKKWFSNKFPF